MFYFCPSFPPDGGQLTFSLYFRGFKRLKMKSTRWVTLGCGKTWSYQKSNWEKGGFLVETVDLVPSEIRKLVLSFHNFIYSYFFLKKTEVNSLTRNFIIPHENGVGFYLAPWTFCSSFRFRCCCALGPRWSRSAIGRTRQSYDIELNIIFCRQKYVKSYKCKMCTTFVIYPGCVVEFYIAVSEVIVPPDWPPCWPKRQPVIFISDGWTCDLMTADRSPTLQTVFLEEIGGTGQSLTGIITYYARVNLFALRSLIVFLT